MSRSRKRRARARAQQTNSSITLDDGTTVTLDDVWVSLMPATVSDPKAYEAHGLTCPSAAYRNHLYSVFVREMGHGALHISFHRHDRAAIRDWRHYQQIKNEVAGPERTAIEVFPPESQLVDSANEYHLWVLPEDYLLPFSLHGGRTLGTQADIDELLGPDTTARQRDWQPGLTTGLGSRW